jgi:hypothetical protein
MPPGAIYGSYCEKHLWSEKAKWAGTTTPMLSARVIDTGELVNLNDAPA